jgi:hypothetical protein
VSKSLKDHLYLIELQIFLFFLGIFYVLQTNVARPTSGLAGGRYRER